MALQSPCNAIFNSFPLLPQNAEKRPFMNRFSHFNPRGKIRRSAPISSRKTLEKRPRAAISREKQLFPPSPGASCINACIPLFSSVGIQFCNDPHANKNSRHCADWRNNQRSNRRAHQNNDNLYQTSHISTLLPQVSVCKNRPTLV